MSNFLFYAGKRLAIVTGFVLFAHSNFMSSTLKQKFNPHPIFKNNIPFSIKSDEDDMMPINYFEDPTFIPRL
jgi:hypothetical protein